MVVISNCIRYALLSTYMLYHNGKNVLRMEEYHINHKRDWEIHF